MNRVNSRSGSALLRWQHHKHCRAYYYYYYYYCQFGVDLRVADDFFVDGIVETLAFFVHLVGFQCNRVGNPVHWWNSPLNKTTRVLCVFVSIYFWLLCLRCNTDNNFRFTEFDGGVNVLSVYWDKIIPFIIVPIMHQCLPVPVSAKMHHGFKYSLM